jgi:hypothetical protein
MRNLLTPQRNAGAEMRRTRHARLHCSNPGRHQTSKLRRTSDGHWLTLRPQWKRHRRLCHNLLWHSLWFLLRLFHFHHLLLRTLRLHLSQLARCLHRVLALVLAGLAEMTTDSRESQKADHIRSHAGFATFRISLQTNLSKSYQETGNKLTTSLG